MSQNKSNSKSEESVEEVLERLSREAKIQTKQKVENEKSPPPENTTPVSQQDILVETLRKEDDKARKLYPERGGEKYKSSWFDTLVWGEGREGIDKIKCERNVYNCVKNSPLVKLMLGALKASGCKVDIRRHISCEVCDKSVTGGYDPFTNQVVVCQNSARSEGMIQGVLTHEFIHMFDYCRHKMDLNNVKHLACTEIRAANLAHCSFMSAMTQGTASPLSIKEQHRICVKERAFQSVKAVKDISDEDAIEAVESVFEKCYKDLEPLGRRIRRNSDHARKAYFDRHNVGYD